MNPTTNGTWIRLLVTTLVAACSAGAAAQDVAVSYTAERTWVDTPMQIQFTIENARSIGEPELPDVDGLEIEYLGITNEFSQTSIINGVRTSKRSVSLSISVNPVRAGSFTIPPIPIEVDGKPYGSPVITLEAVAPTNDDRVLVEITGPDRPVFFGESVELTLEIWIEQYVSELYDVEASESVTWQLVDLNQTRWGPFLESIKELVNSRRKPRGALRVRDGRRYFVYELRREVRPANLGELERLTDVTLAVSYPSGVRPSRSVFNSGLEFSGLVPLRVRAERSDMEVLPLPETDRPADFRGAVGEFLVRASATPTTVVAGDPITLSFLVGNVKDSNSVLDTLRPPPLDELAPLVERFRVPSDPIAGVVETGIKVFTQTIRPRSEDVTEIPAIPFSFFDPDRREYQTIYTEPIPIRVLPAEVLDEADIIRGGESTARPPASDGRDPVDDTDAGTLGLAANLPVDDRLLGVTTITLGWGTAGVLALPPLGFLAVLLVVGRRRWRDRNPGRVRARSARSRCLKSIREARSTATITRHLRTFISDRAGRVAGSITASEALRLSRRAGADPGTISALESLLDQGERAGYGPGGDDGSDRSEEASRLVRALDECEWSRCMEDGS